MRPPSPSKQNELLQVLPLYIRCKTIKTVLLHGPRLPETANSLVGSGSWLGLPEFDEFDTRVPCRKTSNHVQTCSHPCTLHQRNLECRFQQRHIHPNLICPCQSDMTRGTARGQSKPLPSRPSTAQRAQYAQARSKLFKMQAEFQNILGWRSTTTLQCWRVDVSTCFEPWAGTTPLQAKTLPAWDPILAPPKEYIYIYIYLYI